MSKNLWIAPAPHVKDKASTGSIMLCVTAALLPTLFASTYIFGFRALLLTLVCVASCVIFEYLYRVLTKQSNTILDFSAVVTGLLLAYNLPSTFPIWMAMIGCFVAIVVVKQLFGGIGQNFANPAIAARVVLLVSFSKDMANFVIPTFKDGVITRVVGATPLASINAQMPTLADHSELMFGGVEGVPDIFMMLFGIRGGSLGETCAITLLIGGIYLICKKIISPIIPLTYIGTVFVLSWLLGVNPVQQVLAGGLILGAFFMATDYTTSPVTKKGKYIYAVGCGLLTVLIRLFGNYVEGVSFAILLMNIVTPLIDRYTKTRPFGGIAK
ncbi:MAG: RnfABCDGE type electron transport complex subunit D [Oscillospiraceae bacterium]|nr:RnfABCDGE type electron transport complex subunit D [Oscillospiraceae bacterium]MDY4191341.1 RnfABCDGE type electron transport complex subunit D [Oscillospiraceae bacterium]